MELKDFIAETLKQINDGLKDSTTYTEKQGGKGTYSEPISVQFDVALTTSSKDEIGGGAKINVASIFNAGGTTSMKDSSEQYNRVRFAVSFRPALKNVPPIVI